MSLKLKKNILLALELKLVFGPKALFIVLSITVIFPHKFDY